MKLKYLLVIAGLLVFFLSIFIFYYKIDPSLFTRMSFYLDLANPSIRLVPVREGLRKEEIAELVGDKLGWSNEDKNDFLKIHLAYNSADLEGRYFPKTYLVSIDEDPTEVSAKMLNEFDNEITKIQKSTKSENIINQDTILTIASLIEREAGGKNDMRLISGIIWNRLFKGMKLQVDATLQYVKGSVEEGWWQRVYPDDKKIKSEYNTYLYKGLPPGPISNPGIDAIKAAINPQKTDCLFYLHDKKRRIHCSKTYEEHKRNIDLYY